MRQIADLHIHSRFSRACSPQLTIPNIEATCRIKGVDIIATGDFTFPDWFKSIKDELEEIPPAPLYQGEYIGLYRLKTAKDEKVKFILSTEVALIYKQGDKCRRIHLVIHAPSIEAAGELNKFLDKKYNIRSDGRPILGMKAQDLVKLCLSIHPQFLIYPAHIWTPWFAVFGSKSGFNSMEECFGDYAKDIFSFETGLSSDPAMNWRLSELDKLTLLSNSDAHSLQNIGREANVFELKNLSYDSLYQVITGKQKILRSGEAEHNKLDSTIEFYPEEGMYHYSGHRACHIRLSPTETKKAKGICPVCKKPLTIGVMDRVEELADRKEGFRPANVPGFKKLVELDKIIAEALDVKGRHSQTVINEYNSIIKKGGTELSILLDKSYDDLENITLPSIVEGIKRVREEKLIIEPGYDGEYGKIKIFNENEKKKNKQIKMF